MAHRLVAVGVEEKEIHKAMIQDNEYLVSRNMRRLAKLGRRSTAMIEKAVEWEVEGIPNLA